MTDFTRELFDFMYVDRPKVASLLAQFLAEGLIEDQKTTTSSGSTKTRGFGGTTAKIAGLLGLSANFEKSTANETTDTVTKNPEWVQAKALVQYVADAEQQAQGDIEAVGQLRILTGCLNIYDLTPFRQMVDNSRLMDAAKAAIFRHPEMLSDPIKQLDLKIVELERSKSSSKNTSEINARIKEVKKERESAASAYSELADLVVEGVGQFVRHAPGRLRKQHNVK